MLGYGGKKKENTIFVPQRDHIPVRNIEIFITNYNTKQEERQFLKKVIESQRLSGENIVPSNK